MASTGSWVGKHGWLSGICIDQKLTSHEWEVCPRGFLPELEAASNKECPEIIFCLNNLEDGPVRFIIPVNFLNHVTVCVSMFCIPICMFVGQQDWYLSSFALWSILYIDWLVGWLYRVTHWLWSMNFQDLPFAHTFQGWHCRHICTAFPAFYLCCEN